MSAGRFELVSYQTDLGTLVPARVQPETLDATFGGAINSSPPGAPSAGYPSIVISRGKRGNGIHPRTVTVSITSGLPTGYVTPGRFVIPCMNRTAYDSATKGAAAGYLGGTGKVVGKSPEAIV